MIGKQKSRRVETAAIPTHPSSVVQTPPLFRALGAESFSDQLEASRAILHQYDPVWFHGIPEFDPMFMMFTEGFPPSLEFHGGSWPNPYQSNPKC